MRRFIEAKNDRIGTKKSLLFELNFASEIVAAIEILNFVVGEIEVAFDRFGELEKVVVLSGLIIFVAGVDGAKKEWRLGRSVRSFAGKNRHAN